MRERFDKRHRKHARALLNSASQHLYHVRWSLPSKFSWKKSLLLAYQILVLLFNTLAADEKYHLLKRDNLTVPIQMQLSQKQKTFSRFLAAIPNSRWNFEHFDKKDSLIEFEITDSENLVRWMSKKPWLREPFGKQHGKRAGALLESASQQLCHIHWSMPSKLSWETSLLITCEILGLLVNTLAPDEKYPVLTRDNFTIPIQMQLSQKQITFSQCFAAFLKSRLNFKNFEKNIF